MQESYPSAPEKSRWRSIIESISPRYLAKPVLEKILPDSFNAFLDAAENEVSFFIEDTLEGKAEEGGQTPEHWTIFGKPLGTKTGISRFLLPERAGDRDTIVNILIICLYPLCCR